MTQMGLRERKKAETSRRLLQTALALFLERGFDGVSTSEIAAAADVSKMTLFNYFPTKEDLVMAPMEEHVDEPARVVRARPHGVTAVEALRRHFLDALAGRDAATGLNDSPTVQGLQRLIMSTPSLLNRVIAFQARRAQTLAVALAEPGAPTPFDYVRAHQIVGVLTALIEENRKRIVAGDTADDSYLDALALAKRGFALLAYDHA